MNSPALRWPLPALAVWALAWALFLALRSLGVALPAAAFAATLCGAAAAGVNRFGATPWRRVFLFAGFPLSLVVSGSAGTLPAWAWLLPLALLAALYPLKAWSDAPLFPTPRGALRGLSAVAPLPAGARIVDAGCGLGAGLIELHAAYPQAQLVGLEWSRLLARLCAWRCRFAQVQRADIWSADWSGYALVYLFQRPESMARAAAKAAQELRPEAWLVSLEFEVGSRRADAVLHCADGRAVYVYRAGGRGEVSLADPKGKGET
jgi:SAM-dependent methyltransferase